MISDPKEITWPNTVTWDGGSEPTLSADYDKYYFQFNTTDGGSSWSGVAFPVDSATGNPITPPIEPAGLTFPAGVTWENGTAPTFSSVGKKDWFRFETANGGTKWIGRVIDQNV